MILDLKKVTFGYQKATPIVSDITFSLSKGEILAVLGPSGSGKSTILRLIAGLEPIHQGEIYLSGKLASGNNFTLPPEDRNVGMVFQDSSLFPHLTVLKNVTFALSHLLKEEANHQAIELLERLGVVDYASSMPHELSGGQQQRVALARALASKPQILLMDEPFSGLDAPLRREIREDMAHFLRAHGISTIFVTHDAHEANFIADRLILIDKGRFVQQGKVDDMNRHPASAFVFRTLGKTNDLKRIVVDGHVKTPFGNIPAPFKDGAMVDVLFRPQAVQVGSFDRHLDKFSRKARIIEKRWIDGYTVFLKVTIDGESEFIKILTMSHAALPAQGSDITIGIHPDDFFVFLSEG